MSELTKRLLTAIPLIAVVLALMLFAPMVVVQVGVAALLVWAMGEYTQFCSTLWHRCLGVGASCVMVLLIPKLAWPFWGVSWAVHWLALAPWLLHTGVMGRRALLAQKKADWLLGFSQLALFAWGILTIGQSNRLALLLVLSLVWASDSGAYFVGCLWGKHRLAPTISPGKSWEGLAGGMAVAGVVMVLWCVCYPMLLQLWSGWHWLLFTTAMVWLGVVGDLIESLWKRALGIKDSGTLLPGHGGILDRIDGLLPVVPAAALWWSICPPF